MGRGKTSETERDSEEEKKGESSKKVASAERKTGDEDKAFPRHTRDLAKGKSYCWRSNGTNEGATEPKLPKKVEKEGSGRTTRGMDQQDGIGRAWRWNLCTKKWLTRPHAPARETRSAGEDQRMAERG